MSAGQEGENGKQVCVCVCVCCVYVHEWGSPTRSFPEAQKVELVHNEKVAGEYTSLQKLLYEHFEPVTRLIKHVILVSRKGNRAVL